jgi:mannose-6-phosphate isomerase-like protein (cupin superfamily)
MEYIQPIAFPTVKIVPKVWGEEQHLINNDYFCGKYLVFKKGAVLSTHAHYVKRELFKLEYGKVIFRYYDYAKGERLEKELNAGDMVYIPNGNLHSIEALQDSKILEISTPDDPQDSYRISPSQPPKP